MPVIILAVRNLKEPYANTISRTLSRPEPQQETTIFIHLPCPMPQSTDQGKKAQQKEEKREGKIPRRRKPVLQWQGHRAPELQAELEGQGRQKLDNQ